MAFLDTDTDLDQMSRADLIAEAGTSSRHADGGSCAIQAAAGLGTEGIDEGGRTTAEREVEGH